MQIDGELEMAVDVAMFKRSRHIIESDVADDAAIADCLSAAQMLVETGTNCPLTVRTLTFDCRATGSLRWWFPCRPIDEVTQVRWQDGPVWRDLDISETWVEQATSSPQLVFPSGFWASVSDGAAVEITATTAVPDRITTGQRAIILIAGEWYDEGIAGDDMTEKRLSFGARRVIKQGRYQRPCQWGSA